MESAIVLVAGVGSRLGDRTRRIPKCLVEVNGIPILTNTLQHLEAVGVRETVLVVGYLGNVVRERFGDCFGRMRIVYRANTAYRVTGTCYSLSLGLKGPDANLLVLEGDVFFEPRVLSDFLIEPYDAATLVERWNPLLDGSVVQADAGRRVAAWVHKKDRPPGFSLPGTFKTVNIHRFSGRFVRDHLRPAVGTQAARDGGREPIETVLDAIVRGGAAIHAADVTGRWVQIDDEADLRAAEALFEGAVHEHR